MLFVPLARRRGTRRDARLELAYTIIFICGSIFEYEFFLKSFIGMGWLENARNGKGPRQRHIHPPPHRRKQATKNWVIEHHSFFSGIFWVDATRTFHYACRSIDHFLYLILVFAL